jgi:hypothetical protein
MIRSLAVALSLAGGSFSLAATGVVRRGDVILRVKVTGTIVPEDIFRLKSTIDGRIESIDASNFSWHGPDDSLAQVASKELAAIIDSRGTTDQNAFDNRWRPIPIRCPETCFVLKTHVKRRAWVKPQTVIFEASRKLKMVGRVRPEDAAQIRNGMEVVVWPTDHPDQKITTRVSGYLLDVPGQNADPGGSFSIELTPKFTLNPGTTWEGEISPTRQSGVLTVPTAALIRSGDSVYLPVRVSTGLTTEEFTQITAGIEEKREVLILDEAQLQRAQRHRKMVDRAAIDARRREIETAPAPLDEGSSVETQKNYDGEDPYAGD